MPPQRDFEPTPEAVRAARRFVEEALPGTVDQADIVLIVSELASNVVRHAKTNFTVDLTSDEHVRIEVSDGSSIIPAVEELAENKFGLRLIEEVTDRWGIESTDTGKTVWVEFDYDPYGYRDVSAR
jgi:anti-sigma regulatory factor (Ser/Thr protein kinase)